jgi:hypothetical protein
MWGAPYFGGEFQAKLRRPGPGGYQKLGLFITRCHLCWLLLATRVSDGSPETSRPARTIANPAFCVGDFGSPTALRMLPEFVSTQIRNSLLQPRVPALLPEEIPKSCFDKTPRPPRLIGISSGRSRLRFRQLPSEPPAFGMVGKLLQS